MRIAPEFHLHPESTSIKIAAGGRSNDPACCERGRQGMLGEFVEGSSARREVPRHGLVHTLVAWKMPIWDSRAGYQKVMGYGAGPPLGKSAAADTMSRSKRGESTSIAAQQKPCPRRAPFSQWETYAVFFFFLFF